MQSSLHFIFLVVPRLMNRSNKSLNKCKSGVFEPRPASFSVSCRCPRYREPACHSQHTCSLVTQQHAHNEGPCVDAVYFFVHSEWLKEKRPSETVNNGWVEGPLLQVSLEALDLFSHFEHDFYDGRKSECWFDFKQIEIVELNLWHSLLLSKHRASLWSDSEEQNGSCWDANSCMFLIYTVRIWRSEKACWKKTLPAFQYTIQCRESQ